jgi:hypothetical protein
MGGETLGKYEEFIDQLSKNELFHDYDVSYCHTFPFSLAGRVSNTAVKWETAKFHNQESNNSKSASIMLRSHSMEFGRNIDSNSDFAPGLNSITLDIIPENCSSTHGDSASIHPACPSLRHHELPR